MEDEMSERVLKEPIELNDAELEVVSGGLQSFNGFIHEEEHENFHAQEHEVETGGL
jgi:hypothetical protein